MKRRIRPASSVIFAALLAAVFSTVPAAAATSPLIVVGRVDAAPGKAEALRRALQAVVPSTRAEAGNISYELFESSERPGEFLLIEHRRSEAALALHKSRPAYREFFRTATREHLLAGNPDETHWMAAHR